MGLVSNVVSDEVKATVSTDNEYETSVFADQAEHELRVDRDGCLQVLSPEGRP